MNVNRSQTALQPSYIPEASNRVYFDIPSDSDFGLIIPWKPIISKKDQIKAFQSEWEYVSTHTDLTEKTLSDLYDRLVVKYGNPISARPRTRIRQRTTTAGTDRCQLATQY